VPPRDGEGTPPGSDDELLAKVIPLRRRGEPVAPRILADEPRDVPHGLEDPSAVGEWSIWDPTAAEPNRRGFELRVLADEPRGAPGPLVAGEWSIWDSVPPPLRRAAAADAAHSPGTHSDGGHVLGWRRPRQLVGAVTAATIIAAASLVLALGALHRGPGPTSLRASSGLQAGGPSSARRAKGSVLHDRRSRGAAAGSHRRSSAPRTKASRKAPRVTSNSAGGGASTTVRYVASTVQSPTYTATSSPPAESTPPPQGYSATASAAREFGFER
jgi:hypothetical protein